MKTLLEAAENLLKDYPRLASWEKAEVIKTDLYDLRQAVDEVR